MRNGAAATIPAFGAREASRSARALITGKLAGILIGAAVLGLLFALFPLRAHAATRVDVLAVALALALQVLGHALAGRAPAFVPLVTLAALPLAGLLISNPLGAVALACIAMLCAAIETAHLKGQRALVLPLGALLVPALVALAVSGVAPGVLMAGLLLPLGALVAAFLAARGPGVVAAPQEEQPVPTGTGLLAAALAPEGRVLLVSDAMGVIDQTLSPDTDALAQRFPDGSLAEATLIADRVQLLQGLSQAARGAAASAPLTLRLREGHAGAGYVVPPRYQSCLLRAFPLPEHPGRAAVLIEAAQQREVTPPRASTGPTAGPALLARALHDGMAPFNAGLGFLEMVADPRLAPRDFSALHDFAAEAHKAMADAHRNAALMGLWLRLQQDADYAHARAEVTPRRLLTEALRVLNLEDMEQRGDLKAGAGFESGLAYGVSIHAVRFALCVLLRHGAAAAHADLDLAEAGGDLVLTLRRHETPEAAGNDAFQQALEQAAAAFAGAVFEPAGPGLRQLRLGGVASSRRPAETIRMAS